MSAYCICMACVSSFYGEFQSFAFIFFDNFISHDFRLAGPQPTHNAPLLNVKRVKDVENMEQEKTLELKFCQTL